MPAKNKGTSAERELIHQLWQVDGWAACRVAGSGSMKYPSPDIIAQSGRRHLAIECKASSTGSVYIPQEELRLLQEYADRAGCEAWVGVRFSREDWRFFKPIDIPTTASRQVITRAFAKSYGLELNQLLSKHL